MTAILAMLVALAAGWICQRRRAFPDNASETLNRFVLWVCLPALVLARVPGLSLRLELLALAISPWLVAAVGVVAVFGLSRWLSWPRSVTGCLLLMAVLGNTSFVGYPVIDALMGPEYVSLAAVYDQFGTFLLISSFGVFVLASYGHGDAPGAAQVLRRIATFPPLIALVVALALPGRLPEPLHSVCEHLAAPLLPLVAFALGLRLKLKLRRDLWAPLSAGLAVKLLLLPLACWALLAAVPLSEEVRLVAILESAMPPMFTAAALAVSADLEVDLAVAMVGYGLVIGLGSVLAWHWLLT